MTGEDDRMPPLSPLVESLLAAERRRPPPTGRQRRALLRRTHRTLAAGTAGSALLAQGARVARAALAPKAMALILAGALATATGFMAVRPRGGPAPVAPPRPAPVIVAPLAIAPTPPAPTPVTMPAAARRPQGLDVGREAGLIDEARALLRRGEMASALAVLSRHARLFPAGTFREEREALRVVALARSGHTEEAGAAAARFRSAFPRSVFVPMVIQPGR
jgi:hypothetical protein